MRSKSCEEISRAKGTKSVQTASFHDFEVILAPGSLNRRSEEFAKGCRGARKGDGLTENCWTYRTFESI